ncbi:archaeoflavoprotein [Methanocaldococcus bathoardescens]|uniref:Archaeoflavoprotein n=1 Tax=Methanocaldococcus bathoardescens TaxID=1301915 RepID=A0A076LHP6_9EURY|nr:archaeoflavoprotein AfpA [Methanocaldococcus bathoardescens]AIJ05998.1 archaeoflavoprotein [Methanocaldococcus bathoardescens]
MLKIAWGITGCGDKLPEVVEIMKKLKNKYNLDVDIYLSKSAKIVVKWYKLWEVLEDEFYDLRVEVNANAPFLVGKLQTGKYDLFLVAPATANTTAKIAYGIADTLITNSVAQAMKAKVPVYIFPPDNKKGKIETILPGNKKLTLYMRDVDVENVEKIRRMEGIEVLDKPEDIEKVILKHIEMKKQKQKEE